MLPSIFGENLFDDFFNDPFGMVASRAENPLYGKHTRNLICLLYTSPSPRDRG